MNSPKKSYETVSEAVNDLVKRGYTTEFSVHPDKECIICNNSATSLSPEDFEIDEIYRFEGMTDPADETIVYAVSSSKNNMKGVIVNAFGPYSDADTSKLVQYLHRHL